MNLLWNILAIVFFVLLIVLPVVCDVINIKRKNDFKNKELVSFFLKRICDLLLLGIVDRTIGKGDFLLKIIIKIVIFGEALLLPFNILKGGYSTGTLLLMIIISEWIFFGFIKLLFSCTVYLLTSIELSSRSLGNGWFIWSVVPILMLIMLELPDKRYGILLILTVPIIVKCVSIQLLTIKNIINSILEHRFNITGKDALMLSTGLLSAHILLFALIVYVCNNLFDNWYAIGNSVVINQMSALDLICYILSRFFSIDATNIIVLDVRARVVDIIIVIDGYFLMSVLIMGIISDFTNNKAEINKTYNLILIDDLLLLINKMRGYKETKDNYEHNVKLLYEKYHESAMSLDKSYAGQVLRKTILELVNELNEKESDRNIKKFSNKVEKICKLLYAQRVKYKENAKINFWM